MRVPPAACPARRLPCPPPALPAALTLSPRGPALTSSSRTPPPGTCPSHGPSSAFLLLLPRPGLARKGPGRPRNRCA